MSGDPAKRPLAIAHRAGNDLDHLAEAFAAGVDYAETDLWYHRARLEVRHDKTAGPLPFLWERWSLKPGWTPRLLLDEVLTAAKGQGKLLIDLKGDAKGLASALAKTVEAHRAVDAVAFTGLWLHLDRLADLLPDVPRFYTIGGLQRLEAFRPRLGRREIAAVCINSRFLTRDIVAELSDAGVRRIVAWGIASEEMARTVLEWGVGGITADSLPLLVSIRTGEISESEKGLEAS